MNLVDLVYLMTKEYPKSELFGLTSQTRRSAVSVPANIAEGSERSTDKDFANFLLIAKSSLAELETHLLIGKRQGYIKNIALWQDAMNLIEEIRKMLSVFCSRLKR